MFGGNRNHCVREKEWKKPLKWVSMSGSYRKCQAQLSLVESGEAFPKVFSQLMSDSIRAV